MALVVFAALGVAFWLRARSQDVQPQDVQPGAVQRQGVRREAGLNVLLVTVDTLRADALGSYGNERGATPWMDRLAAAGVRFDDAHAHNVVTLPSHANILSGLYPQDHGVRDNSGFRFPPDAPSLAVLLAGEGYRTGAFVSAFPLDSRFGLDRGFEVYDDSFVDAVARPAFLEQERRGTETVSLAREWMAESADRPFFCWVHLYEPHFPYAPPEPFAGRFPGDPYLGDVAAADDALGPLLEPILEAGGEGRTLVVLTSDHGESLGEHGEATHGIFAYEATLRVPLVLYQPRLFEPRAVTASASHVDLLPTVLDALGLAVPEALRGRSLVPAAAGEAAGEAPPVYFEALSGKLHRGWAPLHGILDGRTKLVDLPIPELYDLADDPGESRNLAGTRDFRELRGVLAELTSEDPGAAPEAETAEVRERLRALGYLSGGGAGKEVYTEDDDPKRLIALDEGLREVVALYAAGDLQGALARCRELVRKRPEMAISQLHLAHLERENGNLPAGIEALRKALAASPANTTVASQLGTYLTQAGRAGEAVELLEPFSSGAAPDVEVLVAEGLAFAKESRFDKAIASFDRAREIDPSNAMLLVQAGTVRLMTGESERAREAFESALALNPAVARAHSSLAALAAEEGRVEEAVEHWKNAIALDPGEHDKLLALGLHFGRRGRRAEARALLELFVASAPRQRYERELEQVRRLLTGE